MIVPDSAGPCCLLPGGRGRVRAGTGYGTHSKPGVLANAFSSFVIFHGEEAVNAHGDSRPFRSA